MSARMVHARAVASRVTLAAAAALLAAGAGCRADRDAPRMPADVVARTPDAVLTVDDAARLLAASPTARADSVTVHVLADAWLDQALLLAVAAEDPQLARLDIAPFAAPALEQRLAFKLRATAVRPDTHVTAERLAELWKVAGTGPEVRLHHVLVRWPDVGTDSATTRRRGAAIRDSARAGVDFAALARRHSEDRTTAATGGDLGFRGRGRLPAPGFEPAIADVPAGTVVDLVESTDGVHVVRVGERRYPPVDPDSDWVKLYLQRQRIAAEDAYLDSLARAARIERRENRVARARAAIADHDASGRTVLATYHGGEVTAADLRAFVAVQPPETQDAFAGATDAQVDGAIEQVLWKEVLLREAARRGVTLTAAERDSVLTAIREAIALRVREVGVLRPAARTSAGSDVGAHAQEVLRASLAGDVPLRPLGALSAPLRAGATARLNPASFAEAARRAAALRALPTAR